MAKNITQYSLFISSPSDLEIERFEIPNVIDELNLSYGARQGINLDVIKWETHSAPGISDTYTQDLINKDIGNDYDLFIGMLWLKFGTKTEFANSGTEEEFLKAIERFRSGDKIQILFYFKTTPPISLDEIDTEELSKIKKFKDILKANNILFGSFNTIDELKNHLRLHIPKRIDDLKVHLPQTTITTSVSSEIVTQEDYHDHESDEFGMFDYIFQFEDFLSDSTNALISISDSTSKIGEDIQEKADEVVRISKYPNPNKSLIIEYFKRTAKIMNTFSDRLVIEIPNFYDNFEDAIKVGLKFLNCIDQDNIEDNYASLEANLVSVTELKDNMPKVINGMTSFYDEAKKLPNVQADLNKAKKKLLAQLEDLIFKLKKSYELTNEFQGEIEYKLALINK